MRMLDRIVQQAIAQIMVPLFETCFSLYCKGFRPGRSAHDAVQQAQAYIQEGCDWVVDIGLEKYFDRVNHDMLMARAARVVRGNQVLRLVRKYVQSGIMDKAKAAAVGMETLEPGNDLLLETD